VDKLRTSTRVLHYLERFLPEQRIFLRNGNETRFFRIGPIGQIALLFGGALVLGWTILSTSVLIIDAISAGNNKQQALREQRLYQARLETLANERDTRAAEALQAQQRFYVAMEEISAMQSRLLASEERRKELETGTEVIQNTLRSVMRERDEAHDRAGHLLAELEAVTGSSKTMAGKQKDMEQTLDFLSAALENTAEIRDTAQTTAKDATEKMAQMEFDALLTKEANERIFAKLESAVELSMKPLDKMFSAAGIQTDNVLEAVRRGYNGQGGVLEPIAMSTMDGTAPDPALLRANDILAELERLNLYRLAKEKSPLTHPVPGFRRLSSPFGYRRHPVTRTYKMHTGIDMAGKLGTPVYATADGVVTFADWSRGYGRLVKIQHEFGIETRYAHLNRFRVTKGQRVSQGDHIADLGNSGQSTGPHLHYEVRIGGKPVNPYTYIKAARDVF
jgi:murein DD-endopeptidase MepM/ murein hydrolase activator NlpD